MTATPQEGGGGRDLSKVEITPESYSIDVVEWTDGQVNAYLTVTSETAVYRIHLNMVTLLGIANDLFKAVVNILSMQRKGR